MEFSYLETSRLLLRKVDENVLNFVHENYETVDLIKFLGTKSTKELETAIFRHKGGFTTFNKKILFFQMIDKESKAVIGWCGYHTWYIDHHRAEIGYHLVDDNFKQQGLMTEALKAVVNYGFDVMNLNRIEAFISPTNDASLKLVSKLGFEKEGHLRSHYKTEKAIEDSQVFGLLKSDYVRIP